MHKITLLTGFFLITCANRFPIDFYVDSMFTNTIVDVGCKKKKKIGVTDPVYASKADCDDMGTPVGGGVAGAVTRRNPSTVEGHGYIECCTSILLDAR